MNKKYLLAGATVMSLLTVPMIALAVNDVTLTTDTVITSGGVTFNVTGSSATLSTLTVNTSTFSLTLDNGSSVTVTTADRSRIDDDAATANISASTCDSSTSSKTYTASSNVLITVTPTTVICTTPAASVISGNGPIVQNSVSVKTNQPVTQILGASTTTTSKVSSLKIAVSISPVFVRGFIKNQKHVDITRLQKLLTLDLGISIKITGRFDLATQNALKKFQEKYAIARKGKSGYGVFGPLTRAKFPKLFAFSKPIAKQSKLKIVR